jgi:hypothetical protein
VRIFLVATTDRAINRGAEFERLLDSLDSQPIEVRRRMRLLVVMQNASYGQRYTTLPAFAETIDIEKKISLSRARNIGLRRLLHTGVLSSGALIAYPDDDCWYTPDYLSYVAGLFAADQQLGFWFCDFGSAPSPPPSGGSANRAAVARDVVRRAASITMVLRGAVAAKVGLFDEGLGVGTALPGGEDTDYALRSFLASPLTLMTEIPLVGHRDRMTTARAQYYRGTLVAIGKHASRHPGIAYEFLRKIAIGCVLVTRGELASRTFIRAMGQAGRA